MKKGGRAGSICKDLADLLERLHLPTAPAEYSLLPRGSGSPSLGEDAGSPLEGELFPLVGKREDPFVQRWRYKGRQSLAMDARGRLTGGTAFGGNRGHSGRIWQGERERAGYKKVRTDNLG